MPAGSRTPTRPTAYQLVPYWRALLTSAACPRRPSSTLPSPRAATAGSIRCTALDARRWKAFDSTATPKYLWLP